MAFYADCGVTHHLYETPQNRFEEVLAPPPAVPAAPAPQEDDEVGDARRLAAGAQTLADLHAAMAAFTGCPLKETARAMCPGEGPVGAPMMFIGEAPGRDEDREGRPFVGRSGELLEKMVAALGYSRHEVYITNVIPWRPPENRTPSPIETATCEPFVRREIALVSPKVVVPLGGPSAKLLLRAEQGIMRLRGKFLRYEDDAVSLPARALFHPAYLLRQPAEKKLAWRDLCAIKDLLDGRTTA